MAEAEQDEAIECNATNAGVEDWEEARLLSELV